MNPHRFHEYINSGAGHGDTAQGRAGNPSLVRFTLWFDAKRYFHERRCSRTVESVTKRC